ncbi:MULTISPECIES: hypothetical protein [Bacillus]|uniref:hypothetical protein n=1 Tax=Bacillus TaxID=1386 RepID=UPI0015FD54CC|nr:hypothetical protein [Bacillus sonorensis]GIN68552.1 hypothetical protein J41TS2_39730 [Bacillus sonorensis]
MKMDKKRREIQKKYREEMKKQKNYKSYSIETIIVIAIVLLFIALNLIIDEF